MSGAFFMSTKLSDNFQHETCPNCGSNWDGGSIIEEFIRQRDEGNQFWKDKTDDDIRKYVEGWTDDEILAFVDQNMSFDSEEEMQKFLMQDRKDISWHLYSNFNVEVQGSYSPPYRFSRVIGVEIQGMYDGVSYWKCPDCGKTWNRWTGKEEEIASIPTHPDYRT
jgi:predicted RNA-binding Zn-ribbon protein involved in translation (DUF1610 family)